MRVKNLSRVQGALQRWETSRRQQVVREVAESSQRVYRRQQELCAFGFQPEDFAPGGVPFHMKEHVLLELREDGLGYEMGWIDEIFTALALVFYVIFVEFGTFRMDAQPSLLPALFEEEPLLLARLRRIYSR